MERVKEEVLGPKECTSSKNTTAEISHEPKITNNRNGGLKKIIEIASPNQSMKEKRPKILKGKG